MEKLGTNGGRIGPSKAAERWARIGLAVQFLALVRCLGEYFRLKYVEGAAFDPAAAEVFILAALVVATLTGMGVAAHILRRPWWTVTLAAISVVTLLGIKAAMMG